METYLTLEQYEKLKEAKSAEEVILVAKEAGVELTTEQAEAVLARFHELSDEDLADVAGGIQSISTLYKNRPNLDPMHSNYGYGRGTREP